MQSTIYRVGDKISFSMDKYIPPIKKGGSGKVEKETKLGIIIGIGKADNWGLVPYTLKLEDGTTIVVSK